jgi:hypothetical protein
MEEKYASIRGIYRDILRDKNNNIIFDSQWNSNVIVNDCRIQLAAFMKNDQPKGIQRLKVGRGNKEWDGMWNTQEKPLTEPSQAGLVDTEHSHPVQGEKLVSVYLNENDVEVTETTNRVQITATLGLNEPEPVEGSNVNSYPLREFGLFGEYFDGTEYKEYMIDYIIHPVIHKDVTATLIRVVRLYF